MEKEREQITLRLPPKLAAAGEHRRMAPDRQRHVYGAELPEKSVADVQEVYESGSEVKGEKA